MAENEKTTLTVAQAARQKAPGARALFEELSPYFKNRGARTVAGTQLHFTYWCTDPADNSFGKSTTINIPTAQQGA